MIPENQTISVEEVFDLIKEQTKYNFIFRSSWLQTLPKVRLKKGVIRADELLNKSLGRNYTFEFKPEYETILVIPQERVQEENQQKLITGKVTDKAGNPLTGVTVYIKGSGRGVVTNAEGEFRIPAEEGDVLVFEYLGYGDLEIVVGSQDELQVVMEPKEDRLDDVVLIGYGKTSQRKNTGSVTTVTSETLESQPVSNPILALQGTVPGLFITQAVGKPGGNVSVTIRGINSLNGSEPLYIVDGIPYSGDPMNQFEFVGHPVVGRVSPLNNINPANIESITVLKDADATAIYGSRGANGVILITTKKSKESKGLALQVDIQSGVKEVNNFIDYMSTAEYLDLRREALANDGIEATPANAPDLLLWDQDLDMDWQDYLLGGTAEFTRVRTGISGGDVHNSFSLNASYHNEGTIYPGDFSYQTFGLYSRYDFLSKNNRFRLGFIASYDINVDDSYAADIATNISIAPNYNPYNEDGTLNWALSNPLAPLNSTYETDNTSLRANLNLGYDITPHLSGKIIMGYIKNSMDQLRQAPSTSLNPNYSSYTWGKPYSYTGISTRETYNIEPQLDFRHTLGKGVVSALLGGTIMQRTQDNKRIQATQYSSDAFLDNIAAAGDYSLTASALDYRYLSLFGRLTYDWNDKYIINGSLRRDGSSRFGPDNRFGTFGAVGAAWLFTEEAFFPSDSFLSFGKLRSSYGTTGNDNIGDYGYFSLWSSTSAIRSQVPTILRPSGLHNPDFSWEKVTKFDVALELGFMEDRFLFDVIYYRNETKDQLVGLPLPSQTGFTSVSYNLPGVIRNTGWEFSLRSTNFRNDNFNWNTQANLTLQENKLIEFQDLEGSTYANTLVIGEPIDVVKGYSAYVDPQTGQYVIEDLNGDGMVTYADDRMVLGSPFPEFFGGIRNDFTYKNWNLNFLFQFVKQEAWDYDQYAFASVGSMTNFDRSVLDRWQQPGDVTDVARASTIFNYNSSASNLNWVDASYIKLRNVNFSYSFSEALLSNWGMDNLRLYFEGQNLLTFTEYRGLDPETQGSWTPPLRILSLGLHLNF